MALVLSCSGSISVDANDVPSCASGWLVTENTPLFITNAEFNELWPMLLGLVLTGVFVRYVRRVFVNY